MIEGIISSIIATILVAVGVFLYRKGYFLEWYDLLLRKLSTSVNVREIDNKRLNRIRKLLIRKLISDQTRKGIHYGQFGKSAANLESAKYQGNPENLAIKPRIYLTFWPGVILKKHNLAPRALHLAIKGIQKLYHNNRITVSQSLSSGMLPDKQPVMISYRHTMCGALFLYYHLSWNSVTRGVVDLMIDRRNKWQNSDGGWAHSDREVIESDLWGSVYAIQLLQILNQSEGVYSAILRKDAEQALKDTLEYFKNEWVTSKWTYGGACAEENAVNLFIDIAPILKIYDLDLYTEVLNHLLNWLSPAYDLSEAYIAICSGIPKPRLCARMAYALYKAGQSKVIWIPLFKNAISDNLDDFISTEIAFLIDLCYEY